MSGQNEILDELQKNRKTYEETEGIIDKYLIAHVKNRMFSCYDGTAMSKLSPYGRHKLDIETFRFITTEVFKLTPEQLDSIWSTETIVRMNLSPLAKEIEEAASDEIKEATLFNKRLIVLHECFPDYYACTYPARYNVIDVIHATGTTLRDLSKAGRVDANKLSIRFSQNQDTGKNKGNTGNSGEIVDKIAYNALSVYLKTALHTDDIGEHLETLAHPNLLKIKSLGVSKIIAARGCWASLMDFYYLNSSAAAQIMFFEKFRRLRGETQEYDAISAFMDEIEL